METGSENSAGRLLSLNTGLPADVAWRGETVHTAIWKRSVPDRRMVRRMNVDGDGQGDLAGHGGEHRAVLVYQIESYRYWETQLNRNDFVFGQFGENFTVDGLPDKDVCIGDRYRIGGALFEVTQPRVTCYRVGIRMGVPAMASLLVSHRRPGFYLRVLEEGEVGAGDAIIKVGDGPERISVAQIDALLYLPGRAAEPVERSLRIPALSPGWKASLQALLDHPVSEPGNPGLTGPIEAPPAWPGFRPLRVAKRDIECSDVISLSFEQQDGSPLPPSLPGQFLVLKLPVSPALPPLIRNYSMSGASDAGSYRVSIKREPNGVASSFLHDRVKPGDTVAVSAPRGVFTLRTGDNPVVLLSAGIGATPVLAMLHALALSASAREVWWLYGATDRSKHPFAQESRDALNCMARSHSHIAYSKPGSDDQPGRDYDSSGRLTIAVLDRLGVPRDADYYLCGPQAFLAYFTTGLRGRGTAPAQIHSEIFGALEAVTPGIKPISQPRAHVPSGTPGDGPQVSFARSGITAPWNASFGSLLEFAEACDVPVRWSCRTGVCHTCESGLIGGAVAYQPQPLEPPAEGSVLICCARPIGDVDIDL
jgi:ferredoxin-NADP reductase/MOSC domain-containing protein YiiM/ferredoxin